MLLFLFKLLYLYVIRNRASRNRELHRI